MRVLIDIPMPPSVNSIWRGTTRRGGYVYRSAKYKSWLASAGWQWQTQKPRGFQTIDGKFRATIIVCPPDKRNRDIDNYQKVVLDFAQRMRIVLNDSKCADLHCRWGSQDEAPEGCRLIIEKI